ncbi:MAG: hypothetical protein O9343_17860 [Burkholderiaceae bacterium]|jgi:hypothetical protein|nr:hypothetical protein [Burkholderiaceae bacterium]MCZ8177044.1 hypothetical protein [Burkholderiaceae bacterium]
MTYAPLKCRLLARFAADAIRRHDLARVARMTLRRSELNWETRALKALGEDGD